MKKVLLVCFLLLSFVLAQSLFQSSVVWANEVDDLQKQIDELEHLKGLSEAATKPLEGQVLDLDKKINSARAGVVSARKGAATLAENIVVREGELGDYYNLLKARVHGQYVQLRRQSILDFFLQTQRASAVFQQLAYHEMLRNENQALIEGVESHIIKLEEDKKSLEEKQLRLAALEKQLDVQADFFKGEIAKAKAYQKDLTGKITELSAKQQEIISAKSGSFSVNLGSGEYGSSGKSSRSNFLSEAPSGHFAVFSFGAYSHRNGMSQYGALGRVKQGNQTHEQVLKYYYPGVELSTVDTNKTIVVNGTNTYGQSFNNESFQFEEYLKHIYEIPASWPKEVLKAQAIAARSFAYGKSSICPGQRCQEFKRELNSSAWQEAVTETAGIIMTGGSGNRQFASTHGGWINSTGWDTTDGQGGNNFLEKSYEAIAGSPWVYSSWYVDIFAEWGAKGGTCGQSDPWLSPEEMADIVNAHLLLKKGNTAEAERVSSTSTDCWGGNPYSIAELRDAASKYDGISSANSVSVSQGNGRTNTVTINGVSINGDEFCKAFNLRAPGYLRIPQWSGSKCSGAFFNIERKN